MYYIYHIPERNKIGVSNSLKVRMKKHKWTGSYEILEEHDCIYKVSDREVELQIEYYGKRDSNLLYWQTVKLHTTESRSKGGKTSGKIAVESGQLQSVQSKGGLASSKHKRVIDYKTAQYIRHQYKTGKYTQTRIGECFGVSQGVITQIIYNKTYTTP